MTLRVAAFTGGVQVPSARFRVRQYAAYLAGNGIDLEELGHSSGSNYPPVGAIKRPLWALGRLAALAPDVARSHRFDRVLLQREMVPSIETFERLTGKPRIFDVDDAIHLQRGGGFARRIAASCDLVLAGNDYLADFYRQWNSSVAVLPTAVDCERYRPSIERRLGDRIRIGWIGTSANFPYLEAIEPALVRAFAEREQFELRIVADLPPNLPALDPDRVSFQSWSEVTEVAELQQFDIGLMPLEDNLWARGKCSFKMLQYMACQIPVVVSPVGMNAQVLSHGAVGFAAKSADDWTDSLIALADSAAVRQRMGEQGRRVVEHNYAVDVLAPRFARLLEEVRP